MTRKIPLVLIFVSLFASYVYAQYTWRSRACSPQPARSGVVQFSIGNKAYVVGGIEATGLYLNTVLEYDPTANSWAQKNNFPVPRMGMAVFVINDTAYVGLGYDGSSFYNEFWQYSVASDQWIPVANFPGDPRYLGMAFALNGKGYLGCGFNGNLYNDFYQYDPARNTWTQMADFPGVSRQTGFGAAVHGYGFIGLGWNGSPLNDCYRYNDTLNAWALIANFGGPARVAPGYFVLNDTLYVAAGRQEPNPLYDDCWQYDFGSNSWIQQQNFACYSAPFSTTYGFVANGHGYLSCGDYGDGTFSNQLLEFGPADTAFVTRVHVLGNDTSYCGNFSRVLSTGDPCTVWSTGVTASRITVTAPGTYWAYFPDSCGMASDTIHIMQNSAINFVKDTFLCAGQTLVLNAATANATYHWYDNSAGPTDTVTESGTYLVTVSLPDCLAVDSFQVNIGSIGPVTIGGDTTICASDSSSICAPEGYISYQWNVGSTSRCVEARQAGNYYVTVTEAGGCTAQSNQVLISVYPVPSVAIIVEGDTLSSFGSVSYHWILNGVPINNATSSVYVADQSGLYTLEVTDTNSCTTISNPVNLTMGINELEEEHVSLFPNPSSGNWQLTVGGELLGSKLVVYDDNGRIVLQSEIHALKSKIELNVPRGIYWLQISSPNTNITQKLVRL